VISIGCSMSPDQANIVWFWIRLNDCCVTESYLNNTVKSKTYKSLMIASYFNYFEISVSV
jgi:hypothetical protein